MKTIKLFIISVLLLSSFQALAALITERMNAVENKDQVFRLHSIKTISYAESSDREQLCNLRLLHYKTPTN
jgi:sortase (surface protein transpeptidase)